MPTARRSHALSLTADSGRVVLTCGVQRLRFTRVGDIFRLSTDVQTKAGWEPLFDAERPLVQGSMFDLEPTRYTVTADTPQQKTLLFQGEHRAPRYPWSLRIVANRDSSLLHFTFTAQLPEALTLETPQPTIALWMRRKRPTFQLDQGPESIYGSLGIPFNFGFPAAYLWDAGREAAVFFDLTSARWMQPDGIARFHDVRVETRSEAGLSGLGLHCHKRTGSRLPAGELVVAFALHQAPRPTKPTGLEALDTLVRTFAPLHPSTSEPPPRGARWESLACATLTDLTAPTTLARHTAPWHDSPLSLVPEQPTLVTHPAQVLADPATVGQSWDFSTVNNHLTPWLLFARLHGASELLTLGLQKADSLPRFFDPKAHLIRHGTRQPLHLGDLEMCWQSFFFHAETCRAAQATPSEHFNPAVTGSFLRALTGLQTLAQKTGYVFPQWFDPYEKTPLVQNDIKALGVVREPWQGGSYAYLMLEGFARTGDSRWQAEARRALETLFERLEFRVTNTLYDRRYTDPATFPLTELFGNGYGALAAYRLYQQTRLPTFRRYARDFLNTLLRLTPWYEDETDALSRALKSAGLFYPHGGAHVVTPWETSEAHLAIVGVLRHDTEHPLLPLLLKLTNLNRVNALHFFPAHWPEALRQRNPRPAGEQHFPIEPFYCLEGTGGHQGATAAYMAGLSLWNHWLYDALADTDDPTILVLNLAAFEGYEAALTGSERRLIVYNPGPQRTRFLLRLTHLSEGSYTLGGRSYSAEALLKGIPLTLDGGRHDYVTVRRRTTEELALRVRNRQRAQNVLSHAYQLLQDRAERAGVPERDCRAFAAAWESYRTQDDTRALTLAQKLVESYR